MARSKNKSAKSPFRTSVKSEDASFSSLTSRLNLDMNNQRSMVNLVLGALVVLALGILLFNYFSKSSNEADLGPAGQTENTQTQTADVAKDSLPGKYTIKQGDTLFLIAQKYYDDGYKYPELVKANKLGNENMLEVGQVIDIPKLADSTIAQASSAPAPTPPATPPATPTATMGQVQAPTAAGTAKGGATNQTIWGEAISSTTYTVQPGDWLSKIAGRAYGDVMAFNKIAQANNISNPNLIEVGTVLKIPR